MTESLFKQIDDLPDEIAASVAPHLNLMFRTGGGFIGADDVKDALKVVAIYTRRYVKAQERIARLEAEKMRDQEEAEASELG